MYVVAVQCDCSAITRFDLASDVFNCSRSRSVSRMNIGRCSLAPRCLYITIDSMSLPLNPISPHHQRCARTPPPSDPRVEPMFEVWRRSIANRRRLGALAYGRSDGLAGRDCMVPGRLSSSTGPTVIYLRGSMSELLAGIHVPS